MGQESGKPAWPKPAGGYQTITGRRYGRRHAYVSFRPSLTNPERTSSQHNRECEGLELDDVQKEKILFSTEESCPVTASTHPLPNGLSLAIIRPEVPTCGTLLRQSGQTSLIYSKVPPTEKGQEIFCSSSNPANLSLGICVQSSEASAQSAIAFVNIDSYEPDSSDGEDDADCPGGCLPSDADGKLQQTIDHMLSEWAKDVESLSGMQSHIGTLIPTQKEELDPLDSAFVRPTRLGMDLSLQNNKRTFQGSRSTADTHSLPTIANTVGFNCEVQQKKNKSDSTTKNTMALCSDLNTPDIKASEDSPELVVRPKVRKQTSGSQIDKKKHWTADDEEEDEKRKQSRTWADRDETQRGRSKSSVKTVKEKHRNDLFFDPRDYIEAQKQTKEGIEMQDKGAEQNKVSTVDDDDDDDAFWEDFESYKINVSGSSKDDDSSECSDGEWSACLPSYFTAEKGHSSSDESWETLPGKEEQATELHSSSSSSGVVEDQSNFCFQVDEPPPLEEGEIPWLQYHEDIESSSDEENEPVSQFVHPAFFMLDGNNNLEDDSSMSEDLDVEWRLLDEFGEGIGVAQAISYVDPQFLTYMALEERLAQAMETALAHLESLAVDVEQAHPPASKESIDCLPQVILTEDHNAVGQEQCCAICCSEYIKEEVLTELPCHHFFHKPCVTLWLQKSGTCPVCRHVLTPVIAEAAAAATSFLSDHESPPSIHSAAGTR